MMGRWLDDLKAEMSELLRLVEPLTADGWETVTPSQPWTINDEVGHRTFSWSFSDRNLEVPEERVRVSLTAPSGATRSWNEEASQSVSGPVEDFGLVTRRRHLDDAALGVEGATARDWMEIARAFAGPPGSGRGTL